MDVNTLVRGAGEMVVTELANVSIYVDRSCPEHWIVRDRQGQFWMVPAGDDAWQRRRPFQPTEETVLEPVPGHYRYMLDLPA